MLKTVLLTGLVCGSFVLGAQAQEERPRRTEKGQLTEEQRALMKEIRDKYDANKDGKLDATERKAMTAEDKEKLAKVRIGPRKKRDAN